MSQTREIESSTFPMKAVVRLTGLSPDVLRAWERRYGVVEPERTPGGTRRYRSADVERLQLVKAAVDAGHRISDVAKLDAEELRACIEDGEAPQAGAQLDEILDALERLDQPTAERILSTQLSTLGPVRFAREYAAPLVMRIGEAWQEARICMASEHLASSILRSLLGSALRPTRASLRGATVVFATPAGERHEIGLLIAALTAVGAGANPVYLGPDLPAQEIADAAKQVGASAVALSVVSTDPVSARKEVEAIRRALDNGVELWVGGMGVQAMSDVPGVAGLSSLEELERLVDLASMRAGAP